GQIDILLIPVGGFFTIDHQQATKVVDQLKPKVVIPMHFKTEKLDFPVKDVEPFLKGKEKVIKTGTSEVEITKENINEKEGILVLEHAR
ncbi:MAG: MBL fold metallo-hydrolase, partial [Deltaproteobacteria bacterium]